MPSFLEETFIKNINTNKGVSILFSVLIMSVILSVGLGISGILIQETRIVGEIGHSVVSFYAADSGIERELFELYKVVPVTPEEAIPNFSNIAVGEASYSVETKCSSQNEDCPAAFEVASEAECGALNYCLKSIGSFERTKRAIKIKY